MDEAEKKRIDKLWRKWHNPQRYETYELIKQQNRESDALIKDDLILILEKLKDEKQ